MLTFNVLLLAVYLWETFWKLLWKEDKISLINVYFTYFLTNYFYKKFGDQKQTESSKSSIYPLILKLSFRIFIFRLETSFLHGYFLQLFFINIELE
jgi:hypothetical protein